MDEIHEDLGRVNVSLLFKKGKKSLRNYRLVSLILISGNVMEQITLKTISNPPETHKKMVVASSQHGFTKRKSCLTNFKVF